MCGARRAHRRGASVRAETIAERVRVHEGRAVASAAGGAERAEDRNQEEHAADEAGAEEQHRRALGLEQNAAEPVRHAACSVTAIRRDGDGASV